MMKSATKISENSLGSLKMNSCRTAYELTQLVHTEGKVWTCESQILKSPHHASILSRVRESNTIMWKQVCRRAARSLGRLRIFHVKMM